MRISPRNASKAIRERDLSKVSYACLFRGANYLNCEIKSANGRKITRNFHLFICIVADLKSRPDHATGGKGT